VVIPKNKGGIVPGATGASVGDCAGGLVCVPLAFLVAARSLFVSGAAAEAVAPDRPGVAVCAVTGIGADVTAGETAAGVKQATVKLKIAIATTRRNNLFITLFV
jgi:hypothetical protein